MDNDIVISGIAGRYPECENIEEFWSNLINDLLDLPKYTGKLKNIEVFDASFFGLSDNEANQMDPQMRIFHETTYEAIYDAGVDPATLRDTSTSVYLGSCYNDAANAKFEEITSTTQNLDIGPSEISKRFKFRGATILVDTACASSFSALHEAVQAIKMNICDQVIVGGIALHLKPGLATGFRNLRMLSPDGLCKCLDAKADGYCRSEAVVSMFIQRRKYAKRIYSTILHSKTNSDGYKTEGITFPSRDAQYKLMKECYEEAKIDPEEKISYVEAHITGTPVGDPVESGALIKALRPNRSRPILMGCLKSSIGHTEGGSALCSITKVALALQRRELPPNLNYETPNPNIDELKTGLIKPVIERQEFHEDLCALNSFGFGGVNVHAILKANEKVLKPDDFNWLPESGINRLINISNRTIDGLNYTIDYIRENRNKISKDYLGLIDVQSKIDIKGGLNARGFAILDNDGKLIEKRAVIIDEKRPIWFVFNGLGSQWPGMCKRLLVFDTFRQSIEKMANVLKKYDVDLIHLLTEAKEDAFEKNLCNVLVCITSTQIALVDLLEWLGVQPSGIFGHSVGEYGAAYAAKSATAEQIIELVYHLGRCNNELHKAQGAMASVGLSWSDAVKLCEQTGDKVFASCDNTDTNVTISGDYDQVQQIVDKLNREDVFAKNLFCCEMSFHSPIANVAYEATLNEFRKILINPVKRNDNWISTSVKDEQLNDERFSHFTPDYCSHNMIAPVYFREALQKVPSNAVIIEFGPHSQLLPLIKRQLGANVICVPLTKRNTKNEFDNANILLSGLGQIYQSGNDLSIIDRLYPKVEYPVARETLSLSHLLKWNHEKNYFVAKFPNYFNFLTPTIKYKVDLVDANQKFFSGHCIDGRILFPATGYLNVVWSQLCRLNKKVDANELPVEFHNINLLRAIIIPKNGSATLQITLLEQTGEFSIEESGSVCCTGRINLIQDNELRLNHNLVKKVTESDSILLKSKDIYKELRIRGYDYSGMFQGVVEAMSDGSEGKVKWQGNWVAFSDCMLQLAVFGNKSSRTLHLPTFIEYVRIDSKYLLTCADEMRKETGKSIFEVHYDRYANIGMTKGVIIKGLKASPAPRRQNVQSAKIEYYEFTPYNQPVPEQTKLDDRNRDYLDLCLNLIEERVDKEHLSDLVDEREEYSAAQLFKDELEAKRSDETFDLYQELLNRDEQLAKDKLIRVNFDKVLKNQLCTVIENHFSKQIKIVEVNCTAGLISAEIEEHMQAYHMNTIYNIMQETAASTLQPSFVEKIIEFSAELNTIPSSLDKIQLMIFADWSLSFLSKLETVEFDYQVFLKSGIELMVPGAFLLFCFRSKYTPYELETAKRIGQYTNVRFNLPQKESIEKLLKAIGFVQVSSNFDDQTSVHSILVRKPISLDLTDEDHFQLHIKNFDYSWVDDLKLAVKEKRKRIWLIADRDPTNGLIGMANCIKREPGGDRVRCIFNATDEQIELNDDLKQKDLFFNIYKKNKGVGSYRHYVMNLEKTKIVKDAYVDVLTKGDLSSLRWLELDRTWKDDPKARRVLINYAALNFKDVMVATGRVPLSAYPASRDFCNVGMEFSGIDEQTGKRVFGFTNCATIANKIGIQKESFAIEVPDHWTLAEASTISVVYVTVYYSLFIRGSLLPGESILIHAGSGGVGQAAISVCLRKGCEVYTTVGSEEKKKFLLETFPQLKEENIFNSRTDKFEEDVLKATDGQGVNMILNSLAEEKLRSSINCLSEYGRFIEIGKYDMVVNNKMDMSNFIKNKTFSVVCVAHLQDAALIQRTPSAINIMHRLSEMLKLGIQNGEVQPLPYTVFKRNEVENAFRFMASGKHIGKVLIQVQDENEPTNTYEVLPKSSFSSEKSYIITGGLGGFGLELANWLREKGVRKLLLSSRHGIRTPYQELSIQRLRKDYDINVLVSKHTSTTYISAAKLIEEANEMGPVGGIFNLAMVLNDSILENQTPEKFKEVCLPKVDTSINLDKVSRKLCPQLDYFVCFSSVAASLGNPGQSNYGFANSVMERVVEQRKEDGLHGLAVQFGAIGDVGIVAEQFGNDVNLGGTIPQRIPFCLEILDKFLSSDHAICSSIVLSATKKSLGKDKNDLVRVICHVIGVKDITCLDPNTTLLDLGLDSLMAVEIKQGLEREYETVLSTQEIRELTIRDLQEIGARKQAVQITNRKESTDLTALTIHNIFTKMPNKLFVKLNTVEEKEPIFFIPPIEGSFKMMMMFIDQLNRPVIGVNWTEECSKMNSIKEVAIYLAEKLIEEYPVSTYDFVGYSFGSCIAFQLSSELQEKLGTQSVQKLIFLDGSPDLLRIQTENLIKVNETHDEGSAFTAVTITFVQVFHEIENVEVIRERLLELPTKKEKTEMIAEYLSSKIQFKVDPVELEKALDSYMCKLKMVYLYNPTHKFNGSIKLIKATEKGVMWVEAINDADYGISKLLTEDGSCEVIPIQGDHRTFISNNTQYIGSLIDSIVDYIPL